MRKVLPLNEYPAYEAAAAFNSLVCGLTMLPEYTGIHWKVLLDYVQDLPQEQKEELLWNAVLLVKLQAEEVDALIRFCTDANGVPYTKENKKNLTIRDIQEIIFAVCLEISKIPTRFVNDEEKKNLKISV